MKTTASIRAIYARQQALAAHLLEGRRLHLPARYFRPLGKDRLRFDAAAGLVEGSVDESRATASFVISSMTQDKDGDILLCTGCQLDNYRRNPAVFFNHQQEPLPIGTA